MPWDPRFGVCPGPPLWSTPCFTSLWRCLAGLWHGMTWLDFRVWLLPCARTCVMSLWGFTGSDVTQGDTYQDAACETQSTWSWWHSGCGAPKFHNGLHSGVSEGAFVGEGVLFSWLSTHLAYSCDFMYILCNTRDFPYGLLLELKALGSPWCASNRHFMFFWGPVVWNIFLVCTFLIWWNSFPLTLNVHCHCCLSVLCSKLIYSMFSRLFSHCDEDPIERNMLMGSGLKSYAPLQDLFIVWTAIAYKILILLWFVLYVFMMQ